MNREEIQAVVEQALIDPTGEAGPLTAAEGTVAWTTRAVVSAVARKLEAEEAARTVRLTDTFKLQDQKVGDLARQLQAATQRAEEWRTDFMRANHAVQGERQRAEAMRQALVAVLATFTDVAGREDGRPFKRSGWIDAVHVEDWAQVAKIPPAPDLTSATPPAVGLVPVRAVKPPAGATPAPSISPELAREMNARMAALLAAINQMNVPPVGCCPAFDPETRLHRPAQGEAREQA